jgi:hypothetical protein
MRNFVAWMFSGFGTHQLETRKSYMKNSWNSFDVIRKKAGMSLASLGRGVIHPYPQTKRTA